MNILLKAAFWDYPEFTNKDKIEEILKGNDKDIKKWILYRMLEYARVVDTFKLFDIKQIKENIGDIKLSEFSRNKWNRLIEVYGKD